MVFLTRFVSKVSKSKRLEPVGQTRCRLAVGGLKAATRRVSGVEFSKLAAEITRGGAEPMSMGPKRGVF